MANYRNKKLLDAAKNTPHCMSCRAFNRGDVVAAHANWSEYGKGMGIKANDWAIAYLCGPCHYEIDDGKTLSREEKRERWEEAHRATVGWLFESGMVKVI